ARWLAIGLFLRLPPATTHPVTSPAGPGAPPCPCRLPYAHDPLARTRGALPRDVHRAGPRFGRARPAGRWRRPEPGPADAGLPAGHLPLVQPRPAGVVVDHRPAHGAAGGCLQGL